MNNEQNEDIVQNKIMTDEESQNTEQIGSEEISSEEISSEDVEMDDESPKKKGFHINIHIILIAAIVVILGVAAYELISWNKGEHIVLDPNEDTSEFDIEVLDELIPMSPSDYEGHAFDDETTVLLLGNGDLSMSRNDENAIDKLIAEGAGVTVYNAAFPYPTLATRNLAMIEQNYPDDIYSLTYIADAIVSGDFSEIDRVTEKYHVDGNFTQDAAKVLKAIDYDNLDVIVIMYDASDYFQGRAIENPKDDEERCTIVGSLNYSIRRIKEAYPYIRIIVSSLYYTEGTNEDGSKYDPDQVDTGNGTLSNYFYNALNTCTELSVSYIDNFYGTINQENYKEYVDLSGETDYIKLTDAGRKKLAERISYAIKKYPQDK
ncbi:MAG: hypothetical protein K6G12_08430 [Lachnospiraceae bacterium]|nr:hypothetical protein [Lachnospiraceae bacterium]